MAEPKPKRNQTKTAGNAGRAPNGVGPSEMEAAQTRAIPEDVLETAEILADPQLRAALDRSVEDMREGRVVPLEQVERELGL